MFVNDEKYLVLFQLCLPCRDNLGRNEALGFFETFSSGEPCRVCSADIQQIKTLTHENTDHERTVESYDEDCGKKKFERDWYN